MKCNYCGTDFPDNSIYCPGCGAPTHQTVPQAPSPENSSGAFIPPAAPSSAYPPNPAVELLRRIGKSGLFLVTAIISTVLAVNRLAIGSPDLLAIATTVALWMFFCACREDTGPYRMKTSSLKFLQVLATIKAVFCWIGLIMCLVCAAILIVVAGIMDANLSFLVVPAFVIVLAAAIGLVPSLIIQTGLKNTFRSVKESVETGVRPAKLSKAAPILIIIFAIFSGAGSIFYLVFRLIFGSPITFFSPFIQQINDALAATGVNVDFADALRSTLASFSFLSDIADALGVVLQILFGVILYRAIRSFEEVSFPMDPSAQANWQNTYAAFDPRQNTTATPDQPSSNSQSNSN